MTHKDLIQGEIKRLHDGRGDWQTLMNQVDTQYREIRYNTAQTISWMLPAVLPQLKELDLEWGRGTGKTTVMAKFTRMIVNDMPRGSFQWIVPSYKKFLTEIIPAYIHALEMQGYYKDLHYFIGRRPPASWNWPAPYKPPIKYDNFITFYNGFGIHLLSQDVEGSGRGLSTDGEFADEATMLDPKLMEENSTPSIRGSNMRELGGKRWFDFRLKCSSTALTPAGAWFTDRDEAAIKSPERHRFLRANCVENVKLGILKADYLTEARRSAVDITTFEAEYLNIRPRFVRNGFYALLNERIHAYSNRDNGFYTPELIGVKPDSRGDADCVPDVQLILGLDFGAAINSLTISQYLPGEFRTIKDFFVKGSDGMTQDDLVDLYDIYYRYHPTKELLLFHDATGNHATGNTKLSKAQQFEAALTAKGWKVRRLSLAGTNPRHYDKYRLWEAIFQETNPRLPRFRINKLNARATFVSMSRAKSKKAQDGSIRKDKSSERVDNPQREFATDLSDALDNPIFSLFNHVMKNFGTALPGN